eukprot:9182737-Heterocapsa_arctica.AAC.1
MNSLQIIAFLADYMQAKPGLRKPLSKLGAIRITKRQAKIVAESLEAPNNYSIVMLNINNKGVSNIGYIFYQDLGNFTYAR